MSLSGSRDTVTPQRVAVVLWRRKLVCLVVAIIVACAGAGWLLTRPKVYESTASVALLPVSSNSNILPNYPNLIASLIPTYVQLVSSPVLLNQVAPTLPFAISTRQLASQVHGESLSNAAVIDIVATSRDPVEAQEIAQSTTTAFLAQLRGNGVVTPKIYGQPTMPAKPASPKIGLGMAIVLALAVLLGLGSGLIWDRLISGPAAAIGGAGEEAQADRAVRARQGARAPAPVAPEGGAGIAAQAAREDGVGAAAQTMREDGTGQRPGTASTGEASAGRPPVLGVIPELGGQYGLATDRENTPPGDAGGEAPGGALDETVATAPDETVGNVPGKSPGPVWRSLRTNFMYATADHSAHTVTVTSLTEGEGKTTVALNLAASVAELGLTVVLVDAAVRRPLLHEVLGLDNAHGLTSTMLNGADPASLAQPVPAISGLRVITAGPPVTAPHAEASLYMQFPRLGMLADLVIVDGPPLQDNPYAILLAGVTDGVLLVARAGVPDQQPAAAAALRILNDCDTPVLGTVLTRSSSAGRPSGSAAPQADGGDSAARSQAL